MHAPLPRPSSPALLERLPAVDALRGAVMVLMALDHVRCYAGIPAGGATPGLFFTRWVTHFCAPVFVFLAGTSAYLYGRRLASPAALSRHLLTRGLWLVLLELTVIRLSWTFTTDFADYLLAGVIWAIGWSMVVLAALVRLPVPAILAIGLALVAGHDLLDPYRGSLGQSASQSSLAWLWQLLYFGGEVHVAGFRLLVLYTLVPWIGVIATGYAFGTLLTTAAPRRDRACLWLGLGATALFVVLRWLDGYGDPRPWRTNQSLPAFLSVLNTSKYPASLLFLLMTLGPALALLPLLQRARGNPVLAALRTFGRAPLFYYLLHIPLIHAAAIVVSLLRTGELSPWLFGHHPLEPPPQPDGYAWSLALLYLVTALVVALLYPACARFAALRRERGGWLRWL